MRVRINWIFGNPFGPTAPSIVSPEHAKWLADVGSMANAAVAPAAGASAPAGILLASISAFLLNLYFNGASGDASEAVAAAKHADAH